VFIHKDYRRLGFGGRLVKAALSVYPDMGYYYQAKNQNHASIALAKSLGFEFAGAELYVLIE
jgi:GNAT superfamily N-acetyltransferase